MWTLYRTSLCLADLYRENCSVNKLHCWAPQKENNRRLGTVDWSSSANPTDRLTNSTPCKHSLTKSKRRFESANYHNDSSHQPNWIQRVQAWLHNWVETKAFARSHWQIHSIPGGAQTAIPVDYAKLRAKNIWTLHQTNRCHRREHAVWISLHRNPQSSNLQTDPKRPNLFQATGPPHLVRIRARSIFWPFSRLRPTISPQIRQDLRAICEGSRRWHARQPD